MFICATPRAVLSGFDTFVPMRRVESLQYRLVEMTNNDINAWCAFQPVSTTQEDWQDQHDAISDAENFDVSMFKHHYVDNSWADQIWDRTTLRRTFEAPILLSKDKLARSQSRWLTLI